MQLLPNPAPVTISCCILVLFYSHFLISQSSSSYKTFGFQKFEATILTPYQWIHVNQENAEFIKSRIIHELEIHGFRLQENPDLLINVMVKIDQVFQPREDNTTESFDGETPFPYTNAEMVRLEGGVYGKAGTIIVELLDAKDKAIVWSGSRSTMIYNKNEKSLRKKVNKTVAKIFKNFDPSVLALSN